MLNNIKIKMPRIKRKQTVTNEYESSNEYMTRIDNKLGFIRRQFREKLFDKSKSKTFMLLYKNPTDCQMINYPTFREDSFYFPL